jgi:ceramide glucosyltransferase
MGHMSEPSWPTIAGSIKEDADIGDPPPVSVLKPLHGAEPRLYENLRDFCMQTHPDYELIFGTCASPDDPAIAVVQPAARGISATFHLPGVDPRLHGAIRK